MRIAEPSIKIKGFRSGMAGAHDNDVVLSEEFFTMEVVIRCGEHRDGEIGRAVHQCAAGSIPRAMTE